jgi:zinc protease
MRAWIVFSLVLSGLRMEAHEIPARPELLEFRPLAFPSPSVRDCRESLPNGVRVFLAEEPASSFLRVRIGIRAGTDLDQKGKEGLVRLWAKLLRQGGTHGIRAADLEWTLDSLAATLDVTCDATTTDLRLKVMSKDGEAGLDLLLESLLRPAFEVERIELARNELAEDQKRREGNVALVAEDRLEALRRKILQTQAGPPTQESLGRVSRDDLRAFHAEVLDPRNLVVAVSGRFDRTLLIQRLRKSVGGLAAGAPALPFPPPVTSLEAGAPGIYVLSRPSPQCAVRLALPGVARKDPDWDAAYVLNELLGGSSQGRLSRKIRAEAGLTYGIRSSLEDGSAGAGRWICNFRTQNRTVAHALRLVRGELERVRSEAVPDAELAAVKDGLIQSFPAAWSVPLSRVEAFASDDLAGRPEDLQVAWRDRVKAISPADIQRVARRLLDPARLVVVVVGNGTEAEAGDAKDHPGLLQDALPVPLVRLPEF